MNNRRHYDEIKQAVCETAFWPKCNPRFMRGAESFGDYRAAAVAMAAALNVNADPKFNDESIRRCAEVSVKLIEKLVPMFFIAKDLTQALLKSDPPQDLRWADLKLPYEAAIFIPPRDLIRHSKYGSVDFVGYGRIKTGEIITTPERSAQVASSFFTIFTALKGEPLFPLQQRTLTEERPTIGSAVLTNEEIFLNSDTIYSESPFAKYMEFDDSVFLNELTRFVFGTILAITLKGNRLFIRHGLRKGRHKKSGLPIWTPNVVGRDYKIRTDLSDMPVASGETKRLHWRRGHFRQQPFGSNRAQHKIIWIEPTLIGKSPEI